MSASVTRTIINMLKRSYRLQNIHSFAVVTVLLLNVFVWPSEAIRCDQDAANAEGRLKKKLLCTNDHSLIPLPGNGKAPNSLDMSLLFRIREFRLVGLLVTVFS